MLAERTASGRGTSLFYFIYLFERGSGLTRRSRASAQVLSCEPIAEAPRRVGCGDDFTAYGATAHISIMYYHTTIIYICNYIAAAAKLLSL